MSLFNLLFSFKGRINRGQYWFAALLQGIGLVVVLGGYLALIGSIFPRDFVDPKKSRPLLRFYCLSSS
jgi:uncharacterized membrane protein YhaH (DUF805 family)